MSVCIGECHRSSKRLTSAIGITPTATDENFCRTPPNGRLRELQQNVPVDHGQHAKKKGSRSHADSKPIETCCGAENDVGPTGPHVCPVHTRVRGTWERRKQQQKKTRARGPCPQEGTQTATQHNGLDRSTAQKKVNSRKGGHARNKANVGKNRSPNRRSSPGKDRRSLPGKDRRSSPGKRAITQPRRKRRTR